MYLKVFTLFLLVFSLMNVTQVNAVNDVTLEWVGIKELYQGMNFEISIKVSNNMDTSMYANAILMHYAWMPPNTFNIMDCSNNIESHNSYVYKYSVAVPASSKLGQSSDYAFYLKYTQNDVVKYTEISRITANISTGKSIYSPQPLSWDIVALVAIIALFVAVVFIVKKTNIIKITINNNDKLPVAIFLLFF